MSEPLPDDPAQWLVASLEEELPPGLRHRPSGLGLMFEATCEERRRYASARHIRDWNGLDWRQQPADEWRFFVRWGQNTKTGDGENLDGATILRAATFRQLVQVWLVRFEDRSRLPAPDV